MSRYTQWDFIALVEKHGIPYHEKALGQLFCDNKSSDIVNLLLTECDWAGVSIKLQQNITHIKQTDSGFELHSNQQRYACQSLVIATGGLSIPTMGASPFGYQVASQFGIPVFPTRAALVPFTLQPEDRENLSQLSGVSVKCEVQCGAMSFREAMLFTHRGLSGPAMLQISSYWQPGETLNVNFLPEVDLEYLIENKLATAPEVHLQTLLTQYLPKRLLQTLVDEDLLNKPLKQLQIPQIQCVKDILQRWNIKPNNTEGYRTAEVTLGGVDCDWISSKTFAARSYPHLYFIGEVLDVTGWLGGYNFQWAWSSGWAAGQVV